MYWLGITMDGVAFGNHFKDKFDSLKGAAHSTGGQYRMIVKPLQGTTNDPAVTTKALSEILPESVADDTATLFLVDYSGSILYYAREHREINPALAAAVSAKNSATGAKVGLAAFRSPHLPGHLPINYSIQDAIGSESLDMWLPAIATGPTDIGWGLRKAHETVSEATATNKRVVLVSDGLTAVDMPADTLAKFGTGRRRSASGHCGLGSSRRPRPYEGLG